MKNIFFYTISFWTHMEAEVTLSYEFKFRHRSSNVKWQTIRIYEKKVTQVWKYSMRPNSGAFVVSDAIRRLVK